MQVWVGTAQSNIYKVSLGDLKAQLTTTCHYDRINDIAYPQYAPSSSLAFLHPTPTSTIYCTTYCTIDLEQVLIYGRCRGCCLSLITEWPLRAVIF